MIKSTIQNSFFEIIDRALVGLKRLDFISEGTRDKIINILQEEIEWGEVSNE